jgi:hypothetical protein
MGSAVAAGISPERPYAFVAALGVITLSELPVIDILLV